MDSAKERMEKKVVFSPCCGDETTTYYDRALQKNTPAITSKGMGYSGGYWIVLGDSLKCYEEE